MRGRFPERNFDPELRLPIVHGTIFGGRTVFLHTVRGCLQHRILCRRAANFSALLRAPSPKKSVTENKICGRDVEPSGRGEWVEGGFTTLSGDTPQDRSPYLKNRPSARVRKEAPARPPVAAWEPEELHKALQSLYKGFSYSRERDSISTVVVGEKNGQPPCVIALRAASCGVWCSPACTGDKLRLQ